MNGFRKIFPSFLSHYATFFAKMAERKVVPFDEFYYQLKLRHLFQKHPVFVGAIIKLFSFKCTYMQPTIHCWLLLNVMFGPRCRYHNVVVGAIK
jgi:hypothetical protein